MFSGLPLKADLPPDLRTTLAASSLRTPPSRPRASWHSRAIRKHVEIIIAPLTAWAACRCPGSCPRGLGSRSTELPLQNGSSLLHRQAAKALLRPWNESGLGRADRPVQSATDSVPAGRANRQAGVDAQCRRLSFVG